MHATGMLTCWAECVLQSFQPAQVVISAPSKDAPMFVVVSSAGCWAALWAASLPPSVQAAGAAAGCSAEPAAQMAAKAAAETLPPRCNSPQPIPSMLGMHQAQYAPCVPALPAVLFTALTY